MVALSAADAIAPAVQRTRDFLFQPFRLGTYLKLCLVALITEGLGGNFQGSHGGGHALHHHHPASFAGAPFAITSGWIAVAVAAALALLVLGLLVLYLVTRLRFAYFHCLVHNTKEVGPGWQLYGPQAARFFWLNIGVGVFFLLVLLVVALPFAAGFWGVWRQVQAGGQPEVGAILALALPLIPIFLLFVLAGIVVDVVLRDLMLPHYALENASAGDAWYAVWSRIRAEKGSFALYGLVRVILPVAAMIAIGLVLFLPMLVTAATVALVEVAMHAAFADATGAAAALVLGVQVIVGVVAFALAVIVGISIGGPVGTAIREYALLFYGGRYQRLGEILAPGVA
jgi:hypothetical protein